MPLIHPLQEVIDSGLSQKEAARLIGISPQYLCDLLQQRRAANARVALGVQRGIGADAMTVLIRQAACDLAAELVKRDEARTIAIRKRKKAQP